MNKEEFDVVAGGRPSTSDEGLPETFKADGGNAENQTHSDETTGASPGTAQACDDLGLNSLELNLKRLGIKPPGHS